MRYTDPENYFNKMNDNFKTNFQVGLIFILIASVVAIIKNWSKILTYLEFFLGKY